MKFLLSRPVALLGWLLLQTFHISCSDELNDELKKEPIENGPPDVTENYRYDLPEGETGFSTELPMGHCMVFAGYDLDLMELYLCDPADNLQIGHSFKATFRPHKIEFINGFCTTVIAGEPATLAGAVVIKPPNRKKTDSPSRWTQYGMPDLSQHAIQPDWQCYCAPTSAANVITYFSLSYPELSSKIVYARDSGFKPEEQWLSNRLIAGNKAPFPQSGSFAQRMSTSIEGGTTFANIAVGLKSFIDENARNPSEWDIEYVMENEHMPDGQALWNKLTEHCASGDGILLCVNWGVPVPSSPEVSQSNDDLAEEGSDDSSDLLSNPKQDGGYEKDKGGGEFFSEDSEKNLESTSRSVEIALPEVDQVEFESVSRTEIKDEQVIIIDDFNLEEKKGIWFLKGQDKPFTGRARRSYPNGSILMEIPYLNGKKHGIQTIWEENREIIRKVNWKADQRVR